MANEPNSALVFYKLPIHAAGLAIGFHSSIATTNPHLRLRPEAEIRHFAENGELFAARSVGSKTLLALCYVTFDDSPNSYEIGGLAVLPGVQKLGVASVLVRFAIAHLIANERPWKLGRQIIAYVHEDNSD